MVTVIDGERALAVGRPHAHASQEARVLAEHRVHVAYRESGRR